MEANEVYKVRQHKRCAQRKVREAAKKLDNLANNLGELFRRRIGVENEGEHAMTYEAIYEEYNQFYKEALDGLKTSDKYVGRYFALNYAFFEQNYSPEIDVVDAKAV